MKRVSLFGYLVPRFYRHPENLAVEALGYILRRSNLALAAMLEYLEHRTGASFSEDLTIRTQMGSRGEGITDLEGATVGNETPLIIEAKFWASLTENQPNGYLERLPREGGLLLFLVPKLRYETLWPTILKRVKPGLIENSNADDHVRWALLKDGRRIGMVSWSALLGAILVRLEEERQRDVISDVEQLLGLCDEMDTHAFLPYQPGELDASVGRRLNELEPLTRDLVKLMKETKIADTKGLSWTRRKGRFGHYITLAGFPACLHVNTKLWAFNRETPLWLGVKDNWGTPVFEKTREVLAEMFHETPPSIMITDGWAMTPLYPPLGRERDEVLAELLKQVKRVAELLAEAA